MGCGFKQGCVLAQHSSVYSVCHFIMLSPLRTRADGKLFNTAHLGAKNKGQHLLLREFLFANNAGLITHSEEVLQHLCRLLVSICKQ